MPDQVIVLEPKRPNNRDQVLIQLEKEGPVYPIGQSKAVEAWTPIVENFGPLFNTASPGFLALSKQFKQSIQTSGIDRLLPAPLNSGFQSVLAQGKAQPFNGGLKLDLKG